MENEFFSNMSIVGNALREFTYYVTGDLFITLFLLIGLLVLLMLVFRFPLEWLIILLVPISIYFIALDPRFGVVAVFVLFGLGFILFKYFWFKIR